MSDSLARVMPAGLAARLSAGPRSLRGFSRPSRSSAPAALRPLAVVLYEVAVGLLWARARSGRPSGWPTSFLNAAGLGYFAWLAFEVGRPAPRAPALGLSPAALHGRGEARLLEERGRSQNGAPRAVPADPRLRLLRDARLLPRLLCRHGPRRLPRARPHRRPGRFRGRSAGPRPPIRPDREASWRPAFAGAALLGLPLFYVLPRLRGPYAIAPFRVDDPSATAVTADRVELEAFGSAKRSDRVVLRLQADPGDSNRVLRAAGGRLHGIPPGVWTRGPGSRSVPWTPLRTGAPSGRGAVSIDLNLAVKGFLFLPYRTASLRVEGRRSTLPVSDGVVPIPPAGRAISYQLLRLGARPGPGPGPRRHPVVRRSLRRSATTRPGSWEIGVTRRRSYRAIHDHLQRDFVYTLDPPPAQGDPLVHFLLRSRAGHCEFFASAAALMLASRGIPARLVTGSFGGEIGFFSRTVVVRGGNLHAWVEADLDGSGFSVLDPTPPSGVPDASSRGSMLRRLAGLGREIEFFYDRRILGFEALDQIRMVDAARRSLADVAASASGWKSLPGLPTRPVRILAAALLLAGILLVLWRRRGRGLPPATRGYLELRALLARRDGPVSAATPPAEVARLFGRRVPEGSHDAHAVVELYCASAFGGRRSMPTPPAISRSGCGAFASSDPPSPANS